MNTVKGVGVATTVEVAPSVAVVAASTVAGADMVEVAVTGGRNICLSVSLGMKIGDSLDERRVGRKVISRAGKGHHAFATVIPRPLRRGKIHGVRRAPKVTVTRGGVSLCQKGVTRWLLFLVN
jgi:hypothetical protein